MCLCAVIVFCFVCFVLGVCFRVWCACIFFFASLLFIVAGVCFHFLGGPRRLGDNDNDNAEGGLVCPMCEPVDEFFASSSPYCMMWISPPQVMNRTHMKVSLAGESNGWMPEESTGTLSVQVINTGAGMFQFPEVRPSRSVIPLAGYLRVCDLIG